MPITAKRIMMRQRRSATLILLFSSSLFLSCVLDSKEIHVAKTGDDANSGNFSSPYLTVNMAASSAEAGDTITVYQGTYREWVKPQLGGRSEDKRIHYRAAEHEEVIITGSESIKAKGFSWQRDELYKLWRLVLPKEFFGDFNPYEKLIRQDEYISADETSQGWGWLMYGRTKHRGNV